MYNLGKILIGLIVFIAMVAFPFWNGLGKAASVPEPKIAFPAIEKLEEKQCLEPLAVMRASHMQLLKNWRTEAVREGEREYLTQDGTGYAMSLQGTCLDCHVNKSEFCDVCHEYAGVKPDCWTCHIEPEEKQP